MLSFVAFNPRILSLFSSCCVRCFIYFSVCLQYESFPISYSGLVSTVAGTSPSARTYTCGSSNGVGTAASFCSSVTNLAVDSALDLYLADNSYNRIRKITSSGFWFHLHLKSSVRDTYP